MFNTFVAYIQIYSWLLFNLGIEHFVMAVAECNGPKKLLSKCIGMLKDGNLKYNLCMRYSLFPDAMEIAAKELKDQELLCIMRAYLLEHYGASMGEIVSRIDALIADTDTKWKKRRSLDA